MKKLLIILVILLFLFSLGLYVMASAAEKDFHVKREIDVHAASGFVFGSIASLEQINKWSPWSELDPNMKVNILGNDGYPGAILEWSGNDKVGKGEIKIVKKYPFQRMELHYKYFEPQKSEMNSYIDMGTAYGTTHVVWGFTGSHSLMQRLQLAFTGNTMDRLMGEDLERGLKQLKKLSEERLFKGENDRLVREQKKAEAEAKKKALEANK